MFGMIFWKTRLSKTSRFPLRGFIRTISRMFPGLRHMLNQSCFAVEWPVFASPKIKSAKMMQVEAVNDFGKALPGLFAWGVHEGFIGRKIWDTAQ